MRDDIRPVEQLSSRKIAGRILNTDPGIFQEGHCFQVAAKPCTYLVLQKWPLPAWKLPGRFQEVSRNLPGRIQENTVESMETGLSREDIPSWKLPGRQGGRILPGRMLDGRIKEGILQHPSRKTAAESPVRLEVSWKQPGRTAPDIRIRIYPDISDPASLEYSWNLPGG